MKQSNRGEDQAVVVSVGIDVGDRWSHWCALSSEGEVVDRGRMRTSVEAVTEQASM